MFANPWPLPSFYTFAAVWYVKNHTRLFDWDFDWQILAAYTFEAVAFWKNYI